MFFFRKITKIFTTQKILKMENKHPEHFWSASNSLSENKKKFDFRITLNYFIFVKFIPRIYDVEHYKHFFRNHNNLVIPKKRKKISKIIISSSFENLIVTSKVIRRR